MPTTRISAAVIVLCTLAAACGGGDRVAFIPPPPADFQKPRPPVRGAQAAEMFPLPLASQEFTVVEPDGQEPLRVRYDSGRDIYEIKLFDRDWEEMLQEDAFGGPAFEFNGRKDWLWFYQDYASEDPSQRYSYSSLADWSATEPGLGTVGGSAAFGIATPASGIPVSGTASYLGMISGTSTLELVSESGGSYRAPVHGDVRFEFDFAAGTLGGEIRPTIEAIRPPLAFRDTVFGVGSTTFSGRFDTALAGPNAFSGLFTGPAAQELIGSWVFPFTHDGSVYSASGALIAKRD